MTMNAASTTRLIFETIPQIFESEVGPVRVKLPVDGEDYCLHTIVPLTEELEAYILKCREIWAGLGPMVDGKVTQVIERAWIQQKFAIAWLEARTNIRSWAVILDYSRRLTRRTLENQAVSKTIVIETGKASLDSPLLTDENFFKILDWLGASNLTYFKCDEDLKIKSLEAISLTDVAELKSYRFYPDFLHPVMDSIKDSDSVVVHMNAQGDIIVANRDGIIASNRKGRWTVFDIDHLVMSVGKVLDEKIGKKLLENDPTCVACSMFQILFDVSYKRHGGLIIVDAADRISGYVMKGIERGGGSPLKSIFTARPFNGLEFSVPEVRKLVELSSIDGALVLDHQGNLVQVGSMIVSHPYAQNAFGARDTAAYSAAKNGATAFKVSADGEVSIFFTLPSFTDGQVHRLDIF
jgi:hypothetical protein